MFQIGQWTLPTFQKFSPLICNCKTMCILFVHNASKDPESDYQLIIASNRDEYYDRPTLNLAPWKEDPAVVGGRDLEVGCDGGTWLAISPLRKKIGVLLNLPTMQNPNAKTRGKLVADFVKAETSADAYIETMKSYAAECNHFNFVTIEIEKEPKIITYTNLTDKLVTWGEPEFGASNSLPETPLKKVEAGKQHLRDICSKFKKIAEKKQLIEELLGLLKSREKHLPDPLLEKGKPQNIYQKYSSIYVDIPEKRYGTRTHTLVLITKTGHAEVIEISLQAPVDISNPKWERTEMQFDLAL